MPLGLSGNGLITGFDPTASGFGKVLQVVRATDTTRRTTTSATFVDANLSVTITPLKNTSSILLMASFAGAANSTTAPSPTSYFTITDSSNNAIAGVAPPFGAFNMARENSAASRELYGSPFLLTYATPATTSAVTYKLRFRSDTTTVTTVTYNDLSTAQMFAIEVAA